MSGELPCIVTSTEDIVNQVLQSSGLQSTPTRVGDASVTPVGGLAAIRVISAFDEDAEVLNQVRKTPSRGGVQMHGDGARTPLENLAAVATQLANSPPTEVPKEDDAALKQLQQDIEKSVIFQSPVLNWEEWGVDRVEIGTSYAYYVSPTERFKSKWNAARYPAVALVKGPICSKKNPYILAPGCFMYVVNVRSACIVMEWLAFYNVKSSLHVMVFIINPDSRLKLTPDEIGHPTLEAAKNFKLIPSTQVDWDRTMRIEKKSTSANWIRSCYDGVYSKHIVTMSSLHRYISTPFPSNSLIVQPSPEKTIPTTGGSADSMMNNTTPDSLPSSDVLEEIVFEGKEIDKAVKGDPKETSNTVVQPESNTSVPESSSAVATLKGATKTSRRRSTKRKHASSEESAEEGASEKIVKAKKSARGGRQKSSRATGTKRKAAQVDEDPSVEEVTVPPIPTSVAMSALLSSVKTRPVALPSRTTLSVADLDSIKSTIRTELRDEFLLRLQDAESKICAAVDEIRTSIPSASEARQDRLSLGESLLKMSSSWQSSLTSIQGELQKLNATPTFTMEDWMQQLEKYRQIQRNMIEQVPPPAHPNLYPPGQHTLPFSGQQVHSYPGQYGGQTSVGAHWSQTQPSDPRQHQQGHSFGIGGSYAPPPPPPSQLNQQQLDSGNPLSILVNDPGATFRLRSPPVQRLPSALPGGTSLTHFSTQDLGQSTPTRAAGVLGIGEGPAAPLPASNTVGNAQQNLLPQSMNAEQVENFRTMLGLSQDEMRELLMRRNH